MFHKRTSVHEDVSRRGAGTRDLALVGRIWVEGSRSDSDSRSGWMGVPLAEGKPSPIQARVKARARDGACEPHEQRRASEDALFDFQSGSDSKTLKGVNSMQYAIVIEKAPGSNYSAYVPDLPGCISVGDTLDEVKRMIQEAVELHIEGMREDGLPIPAPSTEVAVVEVAA